LGGELHGVRLIGALETLPALITQMAAELGRLTGAKRDQ
jgi:hypothetical protein